MKQLFMRCDGYEKRDVVLADGYTIHQFHRGGDEKMSEAEYKEGWLSVIKSSWPEYSPNDFGQYYNDAKIPDDGFFTVLNDKGEIIAVAAILIAYHRENTATLHMVFSNPEYRGIGLGRAICTTVMNYTADKNINTVYLQTDDFRIPAIGLYLSLGFKPVFWDTDMPERWRAIMKNFSLDTLSVYDENEEPQTLKSAE